jgi:hypothetical protein
VILQYVAASVLESPAQPEPLPPTLDHTRRSVKLEVCLLNTPDDDWSRELHLVSSSPLSQPPSHRDTRTLATIAAERGAAPSAFMITHLYERLVLFKPL